MSSSAVATATAPKAAAALFACSKCYTRHPFEELSTGQQLCKVSECGLIDALRVWTLYNSDNISDKLIFWDKPKTDPTGMKLHIYPWTLKPYHT